MPPLTWDDVETLTAVLTAILLAVLFVRGANATRKINRIYRSSAIDKPSPILRQIRNGSVVKVTAAAWFAVVTLRALLGINLDEPWLWLTRMGSLFWAAMVLDLPSQYLKMVRRIMNGGDR